MAKKKLTQELLTEKYMNYLLEHGERPKNVFIFMKDLGYKENEFYSFYGSFQAIEQGIFVTFYEHTVNLLEKDENFHTFDPKNKLLSFYFTYFEMLSANRSFVKHVLEGERNPLNKMKLLSGLKKQYMHFVTMLEIKLMDIGVNRAEDTIRKGVNEASWGQFLFVMKYWLNDTSPNFEKTDILIEKTMNTGFELLNTSPLESVMDLGKFLLKETVKKG